ncbi:hypothetical protein MRX96_055167 [Rhipicephalus microplus]
MVSCSACEFGYAAQHGCRVEKPKNDNNAKEYACHRGGALTKGERNRKLTTEIEEEHKRNATKSDRTRGVHRKMEPDNGPVARRRNAIRSPAHGAASTPAAATPDLQPSVAAANREREPLIGIGRTRVIEQSFIDVVTRRAVAPRQVLSFAAMSGRWHARLPEFGGLVQGKNGGFARDAIGNGDNASASRGRCLRFRQGLYGARSSLRSPGVFELSGCQRWNQTAPTWRWLELSKVDRVPLHPFETTLHLQGFSESPKRAPCSPTSNGLKVSSSGLPQKPLRGRQAGLEIANAAQPTGLYLYG